MHQIRSAPDPTGGAHSASPAPSLDLRGPTSNGREGNGREGEGEEMEERGKEGKGEGQGGGRKGKGKVASWLLGGWTPLKWSFGNHCSMTYYRMIPILSPKL